MSNVIYPGKVIENKYNTILETKIDLSQFATLKPISKGAGDTLRIVKRSVTGGVDVVGMGEGNTSVIETTAEYADYVLKTTQGKGVIHDEEEQQDAMALDTMLRGMAEAMTNKWNADVVEQYDQAWANEVAGAINYDNFCDAIALFSEQSEPKFALVSPAGLATLRKAFKDLLSYNEAFIRTGYVGTVNGVPIYTSAKMHDGEVVIADATAVDLLLNKQQEIEQSRNADTRTTSYFIRTVATAALVDATHVARIAAAATTATTCTTHTKATKAIAGAGDGVAYVFVNGKLDGTVDCSSHAYAYTAKENLAAGDVIKVVCKEAGHVSSAATVTVS